MDDATKRTYIQAHLTRAKDDLATAQDNLTHSHWRGAVNRAYYAVFHSASAALLWLDIERAKHSGVQAAFGEYLVKSGSIEPEMAEYTPNYGKRVKPKIMILWLRHLLLRQPDRWLTRPNVS